MCGGAGRPTENTEKTSEFCAVEDENIFLKIDPRDSDTDNKYGSAFLLLAQKYKFKLLGAKGDATNHKYLYTFEVEGDQCKKGTEMIIFLLIFFSDFFYYLYL